MEWRNFIVVDQKTKIMNNKITNRNRWCQYESKIKNEEYQN